MENLVGYARRNFLVPLPWVASFEELNELLRERCRASLDRRIAGRGQTVAEVWEGERSHLLPLLFRAWPCYVIRPAGATLSWLVSFDGNRYSVPAAFAGRNVLVRAYTDWMEIAAGDRVIASHRRSYGRGLQARRSSARAWPCCGCWCHPFRVSAAGAFASVAPRGRGDSRRPYARDCQNLAVLD